MAKEIWDALAMKRALTRITYEIIELELKRVAFI